jgi:hypothetical protein
MSAPSLWWIPVIPVLHLRRYYGLLRPLLAHPGSLRSPLTSRYRLGQRRRRGLPRSWGIPLRACPGLGTPAARREPRLTVPAIQPSVDTTTSASATKQDFGAEIRAARSLACLRFTSPVARRKCKTRYRPARYGVDRAGFAPAGFHSEVSRAHDAPPLPRFRGAMCQMFNRAMGRQPAPTYLMRGGRVEGRRGDVQEGPSVPVPFG